MKSSSEPSPDVSATSALLFEFDHLVVKIREATLEILRSIFDDQEISPVLVSRFGIQNNPLKLVESLQTHLGVKKGTPRKLAEEVVNGLKMHLESGVVQVSDALRDVVVQAREREMPVFGLTALPVGPREALGDRLDLSGLGIDYLPFGENFEPYPRADSWLKVCKERWILGPKSLSLITSSYAMRSALTAGVHCVAIPDRFTDFQDFSGAHQVVGSPGDVKISEVLVRPFVAA